MKKTVCLCLLAALLAGLLWGCAKDGKENVTSPPPASPTPTESPSPSPVSLKEPLGNTITARFLPPSGFTRVTSSVSSFGDYLQHLPLKEDGAPVLLFDGRERLDSAHEAVINMDIGKTDVQQGSDALIRLRAEYLYNVSHYDEINYHFLSGFLCSFSRWSQGYRVKVDGKNVEWEKKEDPSTDYATLQKYLNTLFVYANTRSLIAELSKAAGMQLGDVFINTEFGGVMIVDMAVHPDTQETVFMLVQAKIPAQELHILKNENDPSISPWYRASDIDPLVTPEGTYQKDDLMRFDEIAFAQSSQEITPPTEEAA